MNGSVVENKKNGNYTYEDYLSWDGDERYELIDGWAYLMASASPLHQEIVLNLLVAFWLFLKGKSCKAYQDIDVHLSPKPITRKTLSLQRKKTVVRPDISVVCNPEQISDSGCDGAPTLVVEVHSPSTKRFDMKNKFDEYLLCGVKEYWMVDPRERTVQVCVLDKGNYILRTYDDTDTLASELFPGLEIPLADIFPNE